MIRAVCDAGSRFLRIYPSEQPLQRSLHWIILTGVGVGGNGLTRRWLGRVRVARFVGDGLGASAPVLSNRPRWWQLIQECRHSAARAKRFPNLPHRETWSRLVAICDISHTGMRKVSCPAPAPPPSLRNTTPLNQLLVGCSDLPPPILFL